MGRGIKDFEDLSLKISNYPNFRIIEKEYAESSFGNFYINYIFDDSINMLLVKDRDQFWIDIIIYGFLFSVINIPFNFAVNYVNSKDRTNENYIFDDVKNVEEYLFNNIEVLEFINKNKLIKSIAKQWKQMLSDRQRLEESSGEY